MDPTQAILTKISTLLGADTTTLAGLVSVGLFINAVTPGPGLVAADLVEADFDGYSPIGATAGTRPTATDPATGDRLLTITPPAGGFRWETTGMTNLPQTIYGYAIGSDTASISGGNLWAAARFATPITLNGSDQEILIPEPQLRMLVNGVV